MYTIASEILIDARQVTQQALGSSYEFILNSDLQVIDCLEIQNIQKNTTYSIPNSIESLEGLLFQIHHIRVDPNMDNTFIINCLISALENIGVAVSNPPPKDSMAVCFKPLGRMSDTVRFYLDRHSKLILLSPAIRPRLVCSNRR